MTFVTGQPDFAGLLIMTATVYRRQAAEATDPDYDRFGQPYKTDRMRQPTRDEQQIGQYACRVSGPSGGEQMQERSHDVVQEGRTLYVEPGTDIREQDVVTVTGPDGDPIIERAEVSLVKKVFDGIGEHHRAVVLAAQRESTGITRAEAGQT